MNQWPWWPLVNIVCSALNLWAAWRLHRVRRAWDRMLIERGSAWRRLP